MTTFDEARAAKTAYNLSLKKNGRPWWLRSIGVAKTDAGDHYIKVGVYAPGDENHLPESFSGVRIVAEVVGDIEAQDGS